jgi:hypothetical protein
VTQVATSRSPGDIAAGTPETMIIPIFVAVRLRLRVATGIRHPK